MSEQYLQNYLEAFTSVLESFLGEKKEMRISEMIRSSNEHRDLFIIVGFVGDHKGQVYVSMPKEVALKLSSILAGGMELIEIDEIVKSAMGEFCNMVMGNACTLFSQSGIAMDITPPSIVTGKKFEISNFTPMFCHDIFISEIGKIGFDVTLKNEMSNVSA